MKQKTPQQQLELLTGDVDKLIRIILNQEESIQRLEDRMWKVLRLAQRMQVQIEHLEQKGTSKIPEE